MRLTFLALLALLAACSPVLREEALAVEEEAAPVAVEPLDDPACTPGDDDGIGGTGCQID